MVSTDPTDPISSGITNTLMAIREELMCYFKGDCVEKMVARTNVEVQEVVISMRGRPNYERVALRNEKRSILFIGGTPIAILRQAPDRLELQTDVLRRSPQFKEVEKQLKDFMAMFLPGVIVEEHQGGISYAINQ
jgi:hypothetical protein